MREVLLLRDDRVPIAGFTEALAKLRLHRHAISAGRLVERADRVQNPGIDIAQKGLVGVTVAHAFFSAAFFLRIASWKRSAQPGLTSCSPRTKRSSPSPTSRVTALRSEEHTSELQSLISISYA